jgi:hypothetical protein
VRQLKIAASVITSEAKQSRTAPKAKWIASSLALLAMTKAMTKGYNDPWVRAPKKKARFEAGLE